MERISDTLSGVDKDVILNHKELKHFDFYEIHDHTFYGVCGLTQDYIDFDTLEEDDDTIYLNNYYTHNKIQAWDIIDHAMEYFNKDIPAREIGYIWNALKYILRFPFKGNRNQDIDKAIHYLKRLKK